MLRRECDGRSLQRLEHCLKILQSCQRQWSGGAMPVVPRRSFLIGVALLGLGLAALEGGAAPAAAGPNAAQTAGPVPPGVARVWFLRQFQPSESLQMPMIFVNGAPLASSQPGTTFFRDFSPGSYAFSVETCTQDFSQV